MGNGVMNGDIPMSKYIGGILQSVIILLLIFFGNNVIDNGIAIAVINAKLDPVVKAIDEQDDRIRELEYARSREN